VALTIVPSSSHIGLVSAEHQRETLFAIIGLPLSPVIARFTTHPLDKEPLLVQSPTISIREIHSGSFAVWISLVSLRTILYDIA
jgi:hypothetical protein